MSKKLVIAFAALLIAGLAGLLILKSHTVEIVHVVVVNALVHKAPEGYDLERIRLVLDGALARAEQGGYSDRYLERLKKVSHNLEKRQFLEPGEMDELLAEFRNQE